MKAKGIAFLDDRESRNLLVKHCKKITVKIATLEELIREEVDTIGLERRDGIFERMHEIIRESVGLDDEAGAD